MGAGPAGSDQERSVLLGLRLRPSCACILLTGRAQFPTARATIAKVANNFNHSCDRRFITELYALD